MERPRPVPPYRLVVDPSEATGAISTATTTPATANKAQPSFINVKRSPMNLTAIGSASTGLSAPMINATAMVVYCNVMKKTHRLTPNSTPAKALAFRSVHDGQRWVRAETAASTAAAIHSRQNDSTTPEAPVDLPSTPPNDQNSDADMTAITPALRVFGEASTPDLDSVIATYGTLSTDTRPTVSRRWN